MAEWEPPEVWYAKLPAFYAAAAALITDPGGRVLLVKPNYRDSWLMPGGYVDADELPHHTVRRELGEELGITLEVGALLVVDWAPAAGPRPRAIVNFVFDCGTLADPGVIRLRTEELDAARFFEVDEAVRRLPAAVAPRIPGALSAVASQKTVYLAAGYGL